MKIKVVSCLLFWFLVFSPTVYAAPLDYSDSTWFSDWNQLFISIVDPGAGDVTFTDWASTPQTRAFVPGAGFQTFDWSINAQQERFYAASLDGFDTSWWVPNTSFGVTISDDQNPFTMQYGYYLDGNPVEEWTLDWIPGTGPGTGWQSVPGLSEPFPTPISGTVWLLASGLLAVVGVRRRKPSNAC